MRLTSFWPSVSVAVLCSLAHGQSRASDERSPDEVKRRRLEELAASIKLSVAPLNGEGHVASYRRQLAELPPNAEPVQILNLRLPLAMHLLFVGENDEALRELQPVEELAKAGRLSPELVGEFRHMQAMAYLRMAERENCITNHNEDSCILPFTEKAQHKKRENTERALHAITQVLDAVPDQGRDIWLLNIVHMALGTYPDGVPELYRIPPKAFASEYDVKRFYNIAPKLKLDTFSRAGGSAMEDFDGDGFLDVMTSSSDLAEPLRLFRNKGDGTFEERTQQAGLLGQNGSLHFVVADYDGDRRLDVLMIRGAWLGKFGALPCSLLRQSPDGTFHDVTRAAGIEVEAPSQTAAFADIDNDGDLDLYVGYEGIKDDKGWSGTNRMWRNKGDGTFEDITASSRTDNPGFCKGVVFGDVDGDRFQDLYVSNLGQSNRLFHNNGDGTFTDVAESAGVRAPNQSFATWFFDYDNDGDLDLWVNYYGLPRAEPVCAYYLQGDGGPDALRLYENDGHGRFRDVTTERGLHRAVFPMGSNFGDLDNDGFLDVYLGTGDPDLASLWPNIMLRNDRGQRFQDVTQSGGFGVLQKGHGVSFGDLDNDGDQDVFEQLGGAVKDDGFWDVLFENPGHGHHWLTVILRGKRSNAFGIGARVRVRIEEPTGERDVFGFAGANSSFGGNSLQQELGLGDAKRILFVEVVWPTSNTTQRFENVPLDRFIEVEEDAQAPRLVERKPLRF